ncbi:type II toxin-antitoxin system VapC family toxin [Natranaeroarchaeum aerophilus]|uniref:Ribonuclease VapC n=1 Tax=Natranaeroarchaeum aerophilus TaxID=2917711 RepID=A0AAE3FND0_9EURY|nr:type II toxin-antitoxin system VapC family toxin [Natranaeroarchaeum aerophilus]MCL9812176.1 type II toxin-antitoxin system VapC family toxin [Natranaeroarchaeum aerophilus]
MKLCDTSVLVDIDRGDVADRVERLDDEGRHAISSVTVTELRLELNNRYGDDEPPSDVVTGLERLIARFEIIDVSRPISVAAADIVSELERKGQPLHDLHDVYIAATAQTQQLSVLTSNVDHFERIDSIDVVDWRRF